MRRFKNLKVVVTGGAGYISSHLVEKLLDLEAEVTVIDNFLCDSKIDHLRSRKNLLVYDGDVRDSKVVSHALKDKDVVFHLAAVVGVEETQMIPSEVLDVEIQGTLNVLNSAVDYGIERVVFASSSEVYGDSLKTMREDGPLSPKSTYAVAKLVGEEYCRAFHQKYSIGYTCLRYFNVYGPRQDRRFVIPRFVDRIFSNQPMLIYGQGKQTRDFTYIDDAVDMSLLAGIKSETRCQTINIGTGIMATINEVAELVAKTLGDKNGIQPIYIDYDDTRPREIEVFTRVADITKARKLIQYEPRISLESGVNKYIRWFLENQGGRQVS